MRILVTGGAGYIGSHTVRLLVQGGHDVWVYDSLASGHRAAVPEGRLIVADLADAGALDHALLVNRVEAVMHFAALCYVGESVREPAAYYRNNVVHGMQLLEAARRNGVGRFVFSSTAAVYGFWMNSGHGPWLGMRAVGLAVALGSIVPLLSGTFAARAAMRREGSADLLSAQRVGWTAAFRSTGRVLVIVQVALASGLLVVAMSFSILLSRLLNTDLGLRPDHVLTLAVAPAQLKYPDAASLRAFARDVVSRFRTFDASSEGAAAAWNMPVGDPFSVPVRLPGGRQIQVQYRPVTAGYFGVLGIPLLKGRALGDHEGATAERVAVVNGAFATRYLDGEPLGQHIELGSKSLHGAMRIVGVAANTKQDGPDAPFEPILYVPLAQVPDPLVGDMRQFLQLHFFIPVRNRPDALNAARQVLRETDPDQVVTGLGSLPAEIRKLSADRELDLTIAGAMTLLAILVAMGGLYAVVSMSVASRKRDLAIKAAIGASPRAIALEVLGNAAGQVAFGLIVGAAAGTLAARYLRSLVQGLEVAPAGVVTGTLALLFCAGMAACLAPAIRAAGVNPTAALREE
jgi:hypothetical protein